MYARLGGSGTTLPPSETIGATAAEFGVTPSGTASYTVPIAAPIGTTGVQPKLTLSWSSPGGQGPLGYGGSIVGLSFITRCPTDLYLDGAIDPVDYDANDKFCLNGQRLVAVNGAYGADGTEYRTDLEEFSKVVSYGTAGSGPQRFTVWKKSGEILEYGNTADSRVEALGRADARLWAMNKLSDRLGNYVAFTYFEDAATGDFGVSRVDYTGNDGQGLAPYNHLDFVYETAPKPTISYANGQKYTSAKRLTNVKVYAGTTLFRDYRLTYKSARQLDKIEECATAQCLRPTTFAWKADEDPTGPPYFTPKLLDTSGTSPDYFEYAVAAAGDFNGDGLTDQYLMRVELDGTKNGTWPEYVWLGQRDGTFADITVPSSQRAADGTAVKAVGDFNGDGRTDIFLLRALYGGAAASEHTILFGRPDGTFSKVSYDPCPAPYVKDQFTQNGYACGGTINFDNSLDFNGDGLDDLALSHNRPNGFNTITDSYIWFANPPGAGAVGATFNVVKLNAATPSNSLIFPWQRVATLADDFNGDGLTDLFLNGARLSKGDGAFITVSASIPSEYRVGATGDFNGDGLTDLYLFKEDDQHHMIGSVNDYVWLAKGDGTFDVKLLGDGDGGFETGSGFSGYNVVATGDFNVDGLVDLYVMRVDSAEKKTGATTKSDFIWLSRGDGTFKNVDLTIAGSVPENHRVAGVGDFDGDGLGDLYHFRAENGAGRSSGNSSDYLRLGARLRPDLLTSITNGLGNKVDLVTKPLTDPAVYTKGTGAVYPAVDLADAADIVAQVKTDNGLGGINTQTYAYEGLRAHAKGAGALGFSKMTVTDDATGILSESTYSQDWANRTQGHLTRARTIAPGGVVLEDQTVAWATCFFGTSGCVATDPSPAPGPATRRFIYAKVTATAKRDLNNADLGTTTETSTYDDKGFATRLDAATTLGSSTFSKVTDSVYNHDTANWILGRLASATVTHKAPGVPDKARRSAFAYNATTGLLTSETVEPGDPLFHTKTYAHNAFGAVTSVTETWGSPSTSGIAATSRTTSYTYDAKVRFKLTETNPLGHSETHVYDPVHGLVTQTTGPNALATSWTTDAFGLPLQETRADGTKTKSYRYWCDADTPCPANGAYVVVTQPDGAPLAAVVKDKLNRTLRESTQALDGRTVDVVTEYDARGNVSRKSEPTFDGAAPLWTTIAYDLLSRPLLTTRADGATQSVAYNGLVQTSINELGQTKTAASNVMGWLVASKDHDTNVVTYSYDALGQQTAIIDPDSNRVETDYDVRGNKIAFRDPDRGNWTFRTNALGLLVEQTDAKGQKTSLTYDILGRMLTRIDNALGANPAARTSTWTYDTKPKGVGKLAASNGYGYNADPSYDAVGRPVSLAESMDSATYTVSTTYDSAGRPKTTAYPNGLTVETVYSATGHASQIRNLATGLVYWRALGVDARGNVVSSQLGNGVTESRGYEPATGFLTSIQAFAPGAGPALQDLAYTFDRLGNLGRRQDARAGLDETFRYDALNRVVEVKTTTGSAGVPPATPATTTVAVTYDRLGNIVSRSDVGTYGYGGTAAPALANPSDPNCAAASARPHAVIGVAGTKNAAYCYDANGDPRVKPEGRL